MKTETIPSDLEPAASKTLRAGSLELDYENGDIRQLRIGGLEIIRRVYVAVRDHYWTTADCRIVSEKLDESGGAFKIGYLARYSYGGDEVYEAEVSISGSREAVVTFHVKGRALKSFRRNRIGICVHHPVKECVGRKVEITDADRKSVMAEFPELISPHQPFLDIKKMRWQAGGQADVSVEFEGDIFESEDQRNWGDACYKTYSTPLSIPIPVQVNAGDTIEQKVVVKVVAADGEVTKLEHSPAAESTTWPFPLVGYGRSTTAIQLSDADVGLLKKLPFDGYRCEVRLADSQWKVFLNTFAKEARKLGTLIDLVVFFSKGDAHELADLLKALPPVEPVLNSLLVLQDGHKVTPSALIATAYPLLKQRLPRLKIGYGTDAYFTELNRHRPQADTPFDFVSFSTNPQVHASDVRSIMENVEALPWIIKTARSFAQGKEVYVSPITLRRRRNHDATGDGGRVVEPADYRQNTSFLARFTLLAVAGLAGADKIFMYETTGPGGLMDDAPYPVYKLLQKAREFGPQKITAPVDLSWDAGVILENSRGERLVFDG